MPPLNTFTRSVLTVAISQAIAAPLSAATIIVNDASSASANDANCTLREAITSANTDAINPDDGCTDGAGADLIVFDSVSAITLSSALPAITSDLSIEGPEDSGLTIETVGNGEFFGSLLRIDNATVSLSNITVTGAENGYSGRGGGIFATNSAIVSMDACTVTGNTVFNRGGGIFASKYATVSLTNSTVSGNKAEDGGGVYASKYATVSLTNSTVSDNKADFGAGVAASDHGSVGLINSTVVGNSSKYGEGVGGGVGVKRFASVSLINSTISGNRVANGGGIYAGEYATVSLTNSTVSANSVSSYGGGILADMGASVSLTNTLLVGNLADTRGSEIENFYGTAYLSTDGVNMIGDSDNGKTLGQAFSYFTPGINDITGTIYGSLPTTLVSILAPLASNGGATQTHALALGSPAINAGDQAECASNMITLDQRGEKRNARCDIGAFEAPDKSSIFIVPIKNGGVVIFEL